jgi:hypothetical protein
MLGYFIDFIGHTPGFTHETSHEFSPHKSCIEDSEKKFLQKV